MRFGRRGGQWADSQTQCCARSKTTISDQQPRGRPMTGACEAIACEAIAWEAIDRNVDGPRSCDGRLSMTLGPLPCTRAKMGMTALDLVWTGNEASIGASHASAVFQYGA